MAQQRMSDALAIGFPQDVQAVKLVGVSVVRKGRIALGAHLRETEAGRHRNIDAFSRKYAFPKIAAVCQITSGNFGRRQ